MSVGNVLIIQGISLATVIVLHLLWWYLSFATNFKVDFAAKMLTSPLHLLYAFRNSQELLLPSNPANESIRKFRKKHEQIVVRFGELKSTRDKESGTLAIGDPSKVLSLRPGRDYE